MYITPSILINILLFLWGLTSCSVPEKNATPSDAQKSEVSIVVSEQSNQSSNPVPDSIAPAPKTYSLDAPDAVVKLQKELKEISGLSVLDDKHLAAIQDEKGKIFSIRISDGKIKDEKRFAKDGDFEGVEVVGRHLFVLRSDGDIYKVSNWPTDSTDTKKHETFLSTKHDTEGLGFDHVNNRLLIVCKEDPGTGQKKTRAVYAFDLETNDMDESPVLVINLQEIEEMAPDISINKAIRKLTAPLKNLGGFKPAALAVHPITQQIFVISSVRKIMLAYNQDGTLEDLWVLSEDDFRQPEGLAFMPNGDLFIANEGGNGRATLMRFNYK
ncbi:MAG: SdiA-regulated domain-containing protein [Rhodothermales bacterium]